MDRFTEGQPIQSMGVGTTLGAHTKRVDMPFLTPDRQCNIWRCQLCVG